MKEYQFIYYIFFGMLRPLKIASDWNASVQAAKADAYARMENQLPKGLYNISTDIKERIRQ